MAFAGFGASASLRRSDREVRVFGHEGSYGVPSCGFKTPHALTGRGNALFGPWQKSGARDSEVRSSRPEGFAKDCAHRDMRTIDRSERPGHEHRVRRWPERHVIRASAGHVDGAPHVAGAAALVRAATPTLSPDQVESAILTSAKPSEGSCAGCGADVANAPVGLVAAEYGGRGLLVSAISPLAGKVSGGETVTLTGRGLAAVTEVWFGAARPVSRARATRPSSWKHRRVLPGLLLSRSSSHGADHIERHVHLRRRSCHQEVRTEDLEP